MTETIKLVSSARICVMHNPSGKGKKGDTSIIILLLTIERQNALQYEKYTILSLLTFGWFTKRAEDPKLRHRML